LMEAGADGYSSTTIPAAIIAARESLRNYRVSS
jgi:hypothetical protein